MAKNLYRHYIIYGKFSPYGENTFIIIVCIAIYYRSSPGNHLEAQPGFPQVPYGSSGVRHWRYGSSGITAEAAFYIRQITY
jgi:hypothetical protein